MPGTKIVHNHLGKAKVITIEKSAATAYEKVYTTGTDENQFRLVPVLGHGARVLPLELVPVPGHGARVLPLAMEGYVDVYVQTGARARVPA